jgi:hypothetical protein
MRIRSPRGPLRLFVDKLWAVYGERSACVRDPFGHRWSIGHRIEEVSPAEMQRRYDEISKGG